MHLSCARRIALFARLCFSEPLLTLEIDRVQSQRFDGLKTNKQIMMNDGETGSRVVNSNRNRGDGMAEKTEGYNNCSRSRLTECKASGLIA